MGDPKMTEDNVLKFPMLTSVRRLRANGVEMEGFDDDEIVKLELESVPGNDKMKNIVATRLKKKKK